VDEELEAREKRAHQDGVQFGAFVGSLLKDVPISLGLIFAAILIFEAI
jgi:hypothetical protein